MIARLSKIWIYPIKSLDPLSVDQVRLTAAGSLYNDRRWGVVNAQGQWINGKRDPRVHRLRAQFTLEQEEIVAVTLQAPQHPTSSFRLVKDDRQDDRPQLEAWLSRYFEQPVELRENPEQGFPDDRQSPGPTIVSEATLTTVSQWFPGLDVAEIRLRFRANLELSNVPPFWEDQLFGMKGSDRAFRLGSVDFWGVNPCLRCVVPTRDPYSGQVTPNFVSHFVAQRRAQLPPWIAHGQYPHRGSLPCPTALPRGYPHPLNPRRPSSVRLSPESETI
jgi:uncharacterized protein YcbX